jgi:hypothetical protein
MNPEHPQNLVLGLHPMAQGFAWIVYNGPFSPWAWKVVRVHGYCNSRLLRSIRTVLEQYHPHTLVLEAFEPEVSSRSPRMARLGRALVALAREQGMEIEVVRYGDVQDCFAHVGARTRYEIAEAVARHSPLLEPYLPGRRRPWDGEDIRLGLFCAAALVITHYGQGARRLLDDLRDAA